MRRRALLRTGAAVTLGGAGLAGAVGGVLTLLGAAGAAGDALAGPAPAPGGAGGAGAGFVSTGVRTDTAPMARLFDGLGPIEQAHWVMEGPGPDHPPLLAGDAVVYALLRLPAVPAVPATPAVPSAPPPASGQSVPSGGPAFRDHDRPVADDRAPHALAAHAPPGAVWEQTPGLPLTTNAESCTAWFDRGSGTLCARLVRPRVPVA
ncbi:hypothetical protein ACFC6L_31250 [Kitasatospora phosalacinea]|uniref:hypothetical protein n=1 Tax=Kitasatospora phosalacinea TaxID=2065 RepID=UPI0035E28892